MIALNNSDRKLENDTKVSVITAIDLSEDTKRTLFRKLILSANTYQGPKKIFGPCFLALYKSIIEHNKTLAKIDPSLSVDHIDDYYHHQASGLRHGGVG